MTARTRHPTDQGRDTSSHKGRRRTLRMPCSISNAAVYLSCFSSAYTVRVADIVAWGCLS